MGTRIAISVVIWLVALPLAFLQFIAVIGLLVDGYTQLPAISLQKPGTVKGLMVLLSLIVGLLSWVALYVMNIGWVRNRAVSLRWPLIGTAFAIAGLTVGNAFIVLVALPEIIFAGFLCVWHIKNGIPGGKVGA